MWVELLFAMFRLSVPSQEDIDAAIDAGMKSAGLS